jgi:hypothetical protein
MQVTLPVIGLEQQPAEVLVNLNPDGTLQSVDLKGTVEPASVAEAAGPAPEEALQDEAVVTGRVQGRVTSVEGKQGVADATVIVLGTAVEGTTDAKGAFSLEVPVGKYSLSVIHPEFATQSVDGIAVKEGQAAQVPIELRFAPAQADDVVVTGQFIQGGVADLMNKRQEATSVTDAISAEDIKRSPDSTAGAATRRIVGATVVGGGFLFVRGLGGRYTNVRLNGVVMPSTDPDVPGFQIDLFPSSLLSSLTITKTFSPDIPGDFAGGSLNVETKAFPESFQLSLSANAKYNTQTTGRQVLTYEGGSTDFLATDDGTRALPDEVPTQRIRPLIGGEGSSQDEINEIGRAFDNNWKRQRTTGMPSMSLGFSVGDNFQFDEQKLGYLFTAGYRLNFARYKEVVQNLSITGVGDAQELIVSETREREVGREEAQVGLLGTVSYAFSEDQSLRLVSMLTQTADDTTALVTGFSEGANATTEYTSFRFVQRQLLFNQLLGAHKLFGKLDLGWQLNTSQVERLAPDSREVEYQSNEDRFQLSAGNTNGEHMFTEFGQSEYGGGLDLSLPIDPITLKSGYVGRSSSREFQARRFATAFRGTLEERALPPEQLYEPENYGRTLTFKESTKDDDSYVSDEELHAGYAMLDTPVVDGLRLFGGARLEAFTQTIELVAPTGIEEFDTKPARRSDLDWLPAASAVVALADDMNVRLAYGGTVARPQTRELATFLSTDYVRRRNVQGNPDLKRTFIHNYDARWELFPSGTEVLAASGFYKQFLDPIETVTQNDAGDVGFANIKGASSYGLELELRVSLDRLSEDLSWLSSSANFAWIHSEVELIKQQAEGATIKRPLSGQSPYIANFSLGIEPPGTEFSTFFFYNVFGRRISQVGRSGLPDTYEQPFHSLDWTAFWPLGSGFSVGASVSNLLNQKTEFKEGDIVVSSIERGLDFGLNLGWKHE